MQTLVMTGLIPNASHGVTIQPKDSGNIVAISTSGAGAGAVADAAGVLDIAL
jgi:hypothetical protein